jgi:D-serine deaminase-like pyridoxal phosphate-dependent protein
VRLLISAKVLDITYGVPIGGGAALSHLVSAVRDAPATVIRIFIDSEASLCAVEAFAAAASAAGTTCPVWGAFLKIDVGYHRAGVDVTTPAGQEAGVALARRLASSAAVEFVGLYSHSGEAYAAATPEEARAIGRSECRLAREFKERLVADGLAVGIVSVGSTPSCACADDADGSMFEGATEVRASSTSFWRMHGERRSPLGWRRDGRQVRAGQ